MMYQPQSAMMYPGGAMPVQSFPGAGRGTGPALNPDGTQKPCWSWQQTKTCAKGATCRFAHTGEAAAATTPASGKKLTATKKDPKEKDNFDSVVDYADMEGEKGAATLTITDDRKIMKALTTTVKNEDDTETLEWRICIAPGSIRSVMVEIAQCLHPRATMEDGSDLGSKRAATLAKSILKMLTEDKKIKPRKLKCPTGDADDEKDEKIDRLENVVSNLANSMGSLIEHTKKKEDVQPRGRLSPGTPIQRRSRKQLRPSGNGNASSSSGTTSAAAMAAQRIANLYDEEDDEFEAEFDEDEDFPPFPDLDGVGGADNGGGNPPAAAAAAGADVAVNARNLELFSGHLENETKNFRQVSFSQAVKFTPGQVIPDAYAWCLPTVALGPGDVRASVGAADMVQYASHFCAEDFQLATEQVLPKLLQLIRTSTTMTARLQELGEKYGVTMTGKVTFKRAVTILCLAIARNYRMNPRPGL